ncbi:MAG: thioredoxin family protein [Zoogloeaceae bacterium]|nr:thioredoxin family protein [Zoogloeaceae bacterium]
MANPPRPFLVACLCAAWCGTCRDYRQIFDALAARSPQADFVWVDVEDDADWLGDLDVENFPTLVIQRDEDILFHGVVLPQPGIIERLVSSHLDTPGAPQAAGPEWNIRAALREHHGE